MTLIKERFIRKSFPVEAVRVTTGNMQELAEWCNGTIRQDDDDTSPNKGQAFIKVHVHAPMSDRQTQAYVGDWVLYAGKGFKVYKDGALRRTFDEDLEPIQEQIGEDLRTNNIPDTHVSTNVFEDSTAENPMPSASGANPGGTHTV